MSPEPQDPLTEMATAATAMHELFVAYLEAGFTERQAIMLIVGIATGGQK